jgi:hypothetical protein
MYGVLATGWSLAAYFAQLVVENIQPILISYQKYVVFYILATSCISFGVCYYKGPPTNVRSTDLIKWTLQVSALLAIFFSSDLKEATIGIMIACIVVYYFPFSIFGGFRRFWAKRFPPKRRLLSKEEFEEQGRIETDKALKELREFVKSPKCKEQWKLVMNLSQPTRFASFVEGDEHVTLDETTYHENETMALSSDEDDSDDDVIEESIVLDANMKRIDKSKLKQLQNGLNNSSKRYSFNRPSPQVTSSTPNGRFTRQQNGSRVVQNSTFEISDDE